VQGFHVAAPHWHFENLAMRGVCRQHDGCEHAFHVVGAASHVVIRNNDLRDFNAHLKINGSGGRFPDQGRVVGNTLVNSTPRKTSLPVTPIDLVAASGWIFEGNLIADFVKAGGDYTSYGAFAKGGGAGNRFVRNVVVCERRLRGAAGRRVGLSFGGGGSNPTGCRDRRCAVEHEDGLMDSNLIASCSDVGIYLNRAARSRLVHNTVLDTAGVLVRFADTGATAAANLVDGSFQVREGAQLEERENDSSAPFWAYVGRHAVRSMFADVDALDLRLVRPGSPVRAASEQPDLCGQARAATAPAGAFADFAGCRAR
jgi:hypothetical protein